MSAKKDEKLETAIKAAYKHKNITSGLTFSHLGKASEAMRSRRHLWQNLKIYCGCLSSTLLLVADSMLAGCSQWYAEL